MTTTSPRTPILCARLAIGATLLLTLGACGGSSDPTTSAGPSSSPSSASPSSDPGTGPTSDPTTPSTTPSQPEPAPSKLISYAGGESPGIFVESRADADELRGAPAPFKTFIGDLAENVVAASTCGPGAAVGVGVDVLRTDGFAVGGVNDCGGYAALWAVVDGQWTEIQGTQDTWDCRVLERYSVPSDVVGDSCYDYHGDHEEHDYHQA